MTRSAPKRMSVDLYRDHLDITLTTMVPLMICITAMVPNTYPTYDWSTPLALAMRGKKGPVYTKTADPITMMTATQKTILFFSSAGYGTRSLEDGYTLCELSSSKECELLVLPVML
jgi:hypothetical protein